MTKERLEELINKKQTLYYINCCKAVDTLELSYLPNLRLDIYDDNILRCFSKHKTVPFLVISLNTLYETEQDAEFALKFRDMKREEELSLPFCEEFGNC